MDVVRRFWHDKRLKPIGLQFLFLVVVCGILAFFVNNVLVGMNRLGMSLSFGFLQQTASFDISGDKLISYSATDSYARAILVGILNTLRVAVLGIILATVLGTVLGILRLSKNWLARTVSRTYIELFRNTPLLVQIIIWYSAVFLTLPLIEEEVSLGNVVYFSNRGIAFPWGQVSDATMIWAVVVLVGVVAAGIVYKLKIKQQIETGSAKRPFVWCLATLFAAVLLAYVVTLKGPFLLSIPEVNPNGRSYIGGFVLSPSLGALLIALVMYTSAFIAEIVRAGIMGVNKGQREAAYSLGLKESTALRHVIFPQAYRIIIPPMTNQYLNLTKNSSLAVAIGYPELVSVGNITLSQSGRAIQMVLVMITCYLLFSLLTSLLMNWFNKSTQLVER